jgi:16S rRNA (cytidine1402-2'-O)-methyltransferase
MSNGVQPGLYIIATPIGNLGDISFRAIDILRAADVVAVEDTRVTGKLLHHLGMKKTMIAYHDHSNDAVRTNLVARMAQEVVALVSDAGTPLISDPGYKLVVAARAQGHYVSAVPGACAAIAALTLSGLPSDSFLFSGFLPNKSKARQDKLKTLVQMHASLIFYESAPRLVAMLQDASAVLGNRQAAVVREITKLYEECAAGSLEELAARFSVTPTKGEIVVVIAPPEKVRDYDEAALDALLLSALQSLPPAKAAAQVAEETGAVRAEIYQRALRLKGKA